MKNILSLKVIFLGLALLIPAFYISAPFGTVLGSALVFLGLVFHASVVYQALQNMNDHNEKQ